MSSTTTTNSKQPVVKDDETREEELNRRILFLGCLGISKSLIQERTQLLVNAMNDRMFQQGYTVDSLVEYLESQERGFWFHLKCLHKSDVSIYIIKQLLQNKKVRYTAYSHGIDEMTMLDLLITMYNDHTEKWEHNTPTWKVWFSNLLKLMKV